MCIQRREIALLGLLGRLVIIGIKVGQHIFDGGHVGFRSFLVHGRPQRVNGIV
jgi:hypothetical protein